jgi:hypothetical protein
MPAKKKLSEQELKDRLWNMAVEIDFMNQNLDDHPDFDKWYDNMGATEERRMVEVPAFKATLVDIGKILEEVENSCLSDGCKASLTKALKSASK